MPCYKTRIHDILDVVERHGGYDSELHELIARAHHTPNAQTTAPLAKDMVACDVPPPSWLTSQTERRALTTALTPLWAQMLDMAQKVQDEWGTAARKEMARRRRLDRSWGVLHTVMRAWRECADRQPASARQWENTLQNAVDTGCGSRLARRLRIAHTPSHVAQVDLSTTGTGMVPLLLSYQRLVRAPLVRAMRREFPEWRQHNMAPASPPCATQETSAAADSTKPTVAHNHTCKRMRRHAAGHAQHKWRQHLPRPRARKPISKQVRKPATRRHNGQLRYTAHTYEGMTSWK